MILMSLPKHTRWYCFLHLGSRALPALLGVLAPAVSTGTLAQTPPVSYTIEDRGLSLVRTLVNTPGFNSHGDLAIWHPLTTGLMTGVVFHGAKRFEISGDKDYSLVYPADINDDMVVAGSMQKPQDLRFTRAFRWSNGILDTLDTLGGPYSTGNAINSSGDIAGSAQLRNNTKHAVVWHGRRPQDLGLLGAGDYSNARDINDKGEVVGDANISVNGRPKAFAWYDARMHQLRDRDSSTFCSAQALNNQGDIVGSCDLSDGSAQGVLWKDGRVIDLGTLGDQDAPSTALDINNSDQVVGSSEVVDGKLRAFLWQNGRMYDLNNAIAPNSGWLLMAASRINSSGEIAGRGFYKASIHAFILHPNPPSPKKTK